MYEGLSQVLLPECAELQKLHSLLRASALMRSIGSHGKRSGRNSSKAIRSLPAPIGWTQNDLDLVALAVRYHRGPLPAPDDQELRGLPEEKRRVVVVLSGMLRLAEVFATPNGNRISSLSVSHSGQSLMIRAGGYEAYSSRALKLARGRHLLELAADRPVIIRGE